MADKVHPVPQDAPPAPPELGRHSRSSSLSSYIAVPIPEKDLRKEQEHLPIGAATPPRSSFESTSTTHPSVTSTVNPRQKDFIYRTPAPLPPNHPSYRASRRRRSCCCRCCIFSCVLLAVLLVLLAIGALLVYLLVQPKAPDFSVIDANVSTFSLSAATLSLNSDVTMTIRAENPNTKIVIRYGVTDVGLAFSGTAIGAGSIPAFRQGPKNSTTLALRIVGQDVSLSTSDVSALKTTLADPSSAILLEATIATKVRVGAGGWTSGAFGIKVSCSLKISNPAAGNARLLSKTCSFRLNSFSLQ